MLWPRSLWELGLTLVRLEYLFEQIWLKGKLEWAEHHSIDIARIFLSKIHLLCLFRKLFLIWDGVVCFVPAPLSPLEQCENAKGAS